MDIKLIEEGYYHISNFREIIILILPINLREDDKKTSSANPGKKREFTLIENLEQIEFEH